MVRGSRMVDRGWWNVIACLLAMTGILTFAFAQEGKERVVVERVVKAGLGTLNVDISEVKQRGEDFFIKIHEQATGKYLRELYTGYAKNNVLWAKLRPGVYTLTYQAKGQDRKMKDIAIHKGDTTTVTLLP